MKYWSRLPTPQVMSSSVSVFKRNSFTVNGSNLCYTTCVIAVLLNHHLSPSFLKLQTICLPIAKLLKESAWLLQHIGDRSPCAARDSHEVAHAFNRRCYPYTGNGGHIVGILSSILSMLVEFFIQNKAMKVARSAPQELPTMWTLFAP